MLLKVGEVKNITASNIDDVYCVYPILEPNQSIMELLQTKRPNLQDMILYIYIWHPDEEKFIRGRISTCYYTWFILRKTDVNQLEYFDFLYSKEHEDDIRYQEGMGIIYKVIDNNEE